MGDEKYWNISGDTIGSMIFADINDDGIPELLVGSNDFYIRAYKGEEMIHEFKEGSEIKFLISLATDTFAYVLTNNNIGVYKGKSKLWGIKHKMNVTSIVGINLDKENIALVMAFDNGRIEVRNCIDRALLYKKTLQESVICMDYFKFKGNDEMNLLCYTASGSINGYKVTVEENSPQEVQTDSSIILSLYKQKQQLLDEINSIQGDPNAQKNATAQLASVIPQDLKIECKIQLERNTV